MLFRCLGPLLDPSYANPCSSCFRRCCPAQFEIFFTPHLIIKPAIDLTTIAPNFVFPSTLVKGLNLLDTLVFVSLTSSSFSQPTKWVSPTFLPMLELPVCGIRCRFHDTLFFCLRNHDSDPSRPVLNSWLTTRSYIIGYVCESLRPGHRVLLSRDVNVR